MRTVSANVMKVRSSLAVRGLVVLELRGDARAPQPGAVGRRVLVVHDLRHGGRERRAVVADDAADGHVRELVGVVAQRVLEVGFDAADAREGGHELVVAHDRHVARMDAVGGRQPAADECLNLRGGRPDLAGSAAGLEDVRADARRSPRDRELVGGGHRRRVRDDHHLLAAALDHERRIAAHDLPVEQRLRPASAAAAARASQARR